MKNKIKNARRKLGLTQAELAAAVGVSRAAVQSWELGRRNPGACVIFRIDALLKEAEK